MSRRSQKQVPDKPVDGSIFNWPKLLSDVVSLIDWPAAIVADGEVVRAYNPQWQQIARIQPEANGSTPPTLQRSLPGLQELDTLTEALRGESNSVGMITASIDLELEPGKDPVSHEFTVRWRHLHMRPDGQILSLVVLQNTTPMSQLASVISTQHARINQLLIHQTLIEEGERRRIGQELHDGVAQVLAQIRGAIESGLCIGDAIPVWKAKIERVINNIRTLSFELSPPILEDLGLRPALQWLVEHLGERYKANMQFADDGVEPRLSKEHRTIVFRSVRELAVNAAKHAPGAEIVLSCVSSDRFARIIVKDTGPGFDTHRVYSGSDNSHNYGLLSVEQQIRGIGGSLEINSTIGEGTRATILVPLKPQKETK